MKCRMCGIDKDENDFQKKENRPAQPCLMCKSLYTVIKKSYTGDTDKRKLAIAASRQRHYYQQTGTGGYPKPAKAI